MTLTWTGARFEVASRYEERHAIREAGFRWDPRSKRWWTAEPGVARRLESVAANSARQRLALCAAESQRSRAADLGSDATRDVPCPDGLAYRPFQRAGIAWALGREGALVADEMGLGKTIQAIGVLNGLPRRRAYPAVVVCPASLKINWMRELLKWLVTDATVGIARGDTLPAADIVVINWDILARHAEALIKRGIRVLIADEAHYAKNLKWYKKDGSSGALRAKALARLAEAATRKIFLTGTPVMNRPRDLWPLLSMLDPEMWPRAGFFRYGIRYCGGVKTNHGWEFDGATHAAELQDTLRSTVMIRRIKAEVLKELPSKVRTMVTLPSTAAMLAAEKGLGAELETALRGDWEAAAAGLQGSVTGALSDLAMARHATALKKAPAVVTFVEQILESEDKVIVFAHHKDVIEEIRSGLHQYQPMHITGDVPMRQRQAAVDRFQGDARCRAAICNIQAGGTGLTLTAARTVVFAELDWVPANITQAEDRAHRIGQRDSVQVYHVVLDGSLDARLAQSVVEKQDAADAILDREGEREGVPEVALTDSCERDNRYSSRRPAPLPPDPVIPGSQRDAILEALRLLAGYCDGALERDNMGFNRYDTERGKRIALTAQLSDRDARHGLRLVTKYRRQLPSELRERALGRRYDGQTENGR